jgi:hypothetical protein
MSKMVNRKGVASFLIVMFVSKLKGTRHLQARDPEGIGKITLPYAVG